MSRVWTCLVCTPCPTALLAWPGPCHSVLRWQLCLAGAGDGHCAHPTHWLCSSCCKHSSPSPASTRPCCPLTPLLPSQRDRRCKKKVSLLYFFILDKKIIIYLIALGKQKPLRTSVPTVTQLNLRCELIKKFGWKAFLETLPLQDGCLAETHKWTNCIWKMDPQTSYRLKWKLLGAFSTHTPHQLLATHRGSCHPAEIHRGAVCAALTHPESPAQPGTNLPCLWHCQGSGWWTCHPGIWATLACLCWGAWSNGSEHQPHSSCVSHPSNHAWGRKQKCSSMLKPVHSILSKEEKTGRKASSLAC